MDPHKLKIDHPLFQACYHRMGDDGFLIAVFRFQEWIRPPASAVAAFDTLQGLVMDKTSGTDRAQIRHWGGSVVMTPPERKLMWRDGVQKRMVRGTNLAGATLVSEMIDAVAKVGGTVTDRWDNNSTDGQGYSIAFTLETD